MSAEASASVNVNLDDGCRDESFLCVFCGRPPEEGKVLDCLHAACCRCVMGRVSEHTTVVCVSCQHSTPVTTGPAALSCHHVETVSEEGGEVACSECDDDDDASPAVSLCQTCGQALCEFHVTSHRRTKRTKHHVLVGVSERGKQVEGPTSCQIHGGLVDLYCTACRKPICAMCVPFGHADHERVALGAELVAPARLRLKKAEEFSHCEGEMAQHMQELVVHTEACVKTIEDSALATSEEIEAFFKGLRKKLKEREGELLSEVGCHQRRLARPYVWNGVQRSEGRAGITEAREQAGGERPAIFRWRSGCWGGRHCWQTCGHAEEQCRCSCLARQRKHGARVVRRVCALDRSWRVRWVP